MKFVVSMPDKTLRELNSEGTVTLPLKENELGQFIKDTLGLVDWEVTGVRRDWMLRAWDVVVEK